jgi:Ca2+-binding EF-hand superfamily protein
MKTMMAMTAALATMLGAATVMAQRGPQGPVTRDAYLAMQKERFEAMDANHDGIVTKDELTAQIAARMGSAPPPERIDALFKTMDTDGDGKATAAEVAAAGEAHFAMLDTNHDGSLSPEEFRAGMGQMMGGRRQ